MTQSIERASQQRKWLWFEVIAMYSAMTMITFGSLWLDGLWAPLAGVSALVVALGFMLLPIEWLSAKGEAPQAFGIGGRADQCQQSSEIDEMHDSAQTQAYLIHQESTRERIIRSTRQALKISLIVLPFYWVATHFWHQVQGQPATWETRAFSRWSEEVRGFSDHPLPIGSVSIEARADLLKIRWRLRSRTQAKLQLSFHHTLDQQDLVYDEYHAHRNVHMKTLRSTDPMRTELEFSAHQSGWITLKTPVNQVFLSAWINGKPLKEGMIFGGEQGNKLAVTQEGITEVERNYHWLWSLFLIQLFMVGLPEEIFYRGYLQTRLDGLIGRDQTVFGVPFNWASVTLCSALFALAHLITIPHPARLAVFFPSLLFGWMRRAYHDTLPPAIFHAICNVSAQLCWGIYVLG